MSEPLSREQREEDFREFHAQHLRRQTAAVETIRTIIVIWAVLTLIGVLVIGAQLS